MIDSVLTSGCSFISQHIWIKICIVLAILGRCIKIEKFSTGKNDMWICISGQQIDRLGTLCSGIVTGLGGWHVGQWWRRLWSRVSVSVGGRCICSFASPACLRIPCGAILKWMAAGCVVLMTHSRVSFYCSLHHFMRRKLNARLLLITDLGMSVLDHRFCFLHCSARKSLFGHFSHIQGQAHVGLLQLYPTSLPCHSSRPVENLKEISCCF